VKKEQLDTGTTHSSVNDDGKAKFFLKTHDAAFADRPKFASGKYMACGYSDILLAPYGSYWRQARKICTAELLSAKRLESLEYVRDEEVRVLLRNLHGVSGSVRAVRLRDYLQTMTLGVISRSHGTVLGKKYVEEETRGKGTSPSVTPTSEEFFEMVKEFFVIHGAFNIGDFVPYVAVLAGPAGVRQEDEADRQGVLAVSGACYRRARREAPA
jgi:typhasterol/6-deoxotyphasterol 2alpha-hydroxylase